jgi:hypothetical protein
MDHRMVVKKHLRVNQREEEEWKDLDEMAGRC